MNEAPSDHCCAAVAAQTRNFWSTWTHNSNCQQIKTGGEKALQMFPGNRNISKWLKLQCWGNSSAGGLFAWNSDFDVYVQTSRGVYEPWKHTRHFFNTIKQIVSLRGVIHFILCPELNLLQKNDAYISCSQPLGHMDHKTFNRKATKKKVLFTYTGHKCLLSFSHFPLAVAVFSFLPLHAY